MTLKREKTRESRTGSSVVNGTFFAEDYSTTQAMTATRKR